MSKTDKKTPLTAYNSMMNLLARRDHSEKELRKKLGLKFPPDQVEKAIESAKSRGWILKAEELSSKFSAQLHRQKRGVRAINHKLKEKGLPPIEADRELELEKAFALAQNKLSRLKNPVDQVAREKVGRFLISRGFEMEIVRKVIYEKLRS